jgi:CheY-like chemotaxis protein
MLMRTLKANGHTGEEAEDGQIAVDKVKEKGLTTYDAILMDFVMPVMDGPDATKAIRELGYTGPIIGCTGNTLDMDLDRFKESGCDRVIGKPFEPEKFHQFMNELTIGNSLLI